MPNRLNDIINMTTPMGGVQTSFTAPSSAPTPGAGPVMDFRSGMSTPQNFRDGGLVPTGPVAPGAQPPGGAPGGAPGGQQLSLDQMQGEAQRLAQQNPEVMQQIQQAIQAAMESGKLTPQQLNMAVQLANAAAQNPQMYPRLRQLAIQQGLVDEDELPLQYDQGIVMAMVLAGQAVQQQVGTGVGDVPAAGGPGFAMGGHIPPEASPTNDTTGRRDDIGIKVSGGEYVIPEHIVQRKGTEFFDKLIGKDEGTKKA